MSGPVEASTTLAVAVAVFVIVQGVNTFKRHRQPPSSPYMLRFSVLTFLLAILTFIWLTMFLERALIHSPELDVLMVQGTVAAIWLVALIVGLVVACGLAWHSAR